MLSQYIIIMGNKNEITKTLAKYCMYTSVFVILAEHNTPHNETNKEINKYIKSKNNYIINRIKNTKDVLFVPNEAII